MIYIQYEQNIASAPAKAATIGSHKYLLRSLAERTPSQRNATLHQ